MKALSKILLIIISGVISFASCKEKETYSPVPFIENAVLFHNYAVSGKDSVLTLKFSFTDGDGDIGIPQSDTSKNLFLTYFEKQKGQYVMPLSVPFTYRIPELDSDGSNSAIKGEVEVSGIVFNNASVYDTIVFDIQLFDRSNNSSNIIRTADFVINK